MLQGRESIPNREQRDIKIQRKRDRVGYKLREKRDTDNTIGDT